MEDRDELAFALKNFSSFMRNCSPLIPQISGTNRMTMMLLYSEITENNESAFSGKLTDRKRCGSSFVLADLASTKISTFFSPKSWFWR